MNGDQPYAFRFRLIGQLSANGPTPLLCFGQLPTFSPSLCLRAQCRSHQSLVVFGHPALPHAYVAANPSSTKMSPTSRPFVLSVPQVRPKLQNHLPSVAAGTDI